MGIVWRRFGAPSMEAFFYVLISFLLLNMDLLGEGIHVYTLLGMSLCFLV